MEKLRFEVLIPEEKLRERVAELGARISEDYRGKDTIFVGILKGSFIFMADLLRRVRLDSLAMDFMMVSSYGSGTVSSGNIRIKKDMEQDVAGKHVLLVEDIVDSGNTLTYLKRFLATRKPASVKVVTMLDKPSRREVPLVPDYCGFEIPDAFVVGCGLDYDQRFRELKDICVLHFDG